MGTFLQWTSSSFITFTRQELKRIHLHFVHPSVSKVSSLLNRAYPDKLKNDTIQLLTDIAKSCHFCHQYSSQNITFCARFLDDAIFNKLITKSLHYLEGSTVLQIEGSRTNFSAERLVHDVDNRTIWDKFVILWVDMYLGFPSHIHPEEGTAFNSNGWVSLCSDASIKTFPNGTKSHNIWNKKRRIMLWFAAYTTKLENRRHKPLKKLSLLLVVKTMNDTAGRNGLRPSLQLFGKMPKVPSTQDINFSRTESHKLIIIPRKELEDIVPKIRFKSTLSHWPPMRKSGFDSKLVSERWSESCHHLLTRFELSLVSWFIIFEKRKVLDWLTPCAARGWKRSFCWPWRTFCWTSI